MRVVNIEIPPTLRVLTTSEIEQLAICTINGHAGREAIGKILSERFETKRKVNSVLSQLSWQDIVSFNCDVQKAAVDVDFKSTYFLLIEPHRTLMAIKQ